MVVYAIKNGDELETDNITLREENLFTYLKIYDTPKPLSDFVNTKGKTITRAPQSWQYVELKGE